MFYSFNHLIMVLSIINTMLLHNFIQFMQYYLLLKHEHGILNRLIKQIFSKLIYQKMFFLILLNPKILKHWRNCFLRRTKL